VMLAGIPVLFISDIARFLYFWIYSCLSYEVTVPEDTGTLAVLHEKNRTGSRNINLICFIDSTFQAKVNIFGSIIRKDDDYDD
ncbi:unnamed protein product, partial [marine sediment metagenome]